MSKINIAFATDDNYVMPTVVAMTSLFESTPHDIEIYLLSIEGHLTEQNRKELQRVADKYEQGITFADVSIDRFDGLPSFRHGLSTYLRLFAAELFPHIDKILYLDCDVIVNGSIRELYDTDMDGYLCAGVADQRSVDHNYLDMIGYNHTHRHYINAGVLLMNLGAMRHLDIKGKIAEYLREYKEVIRLGDQDIINCIFPEIKILHPKYNAITSILLNLYNRNRFQLWSMEWVREAAKHPIVIHYVSSKKPWKRDSVHLYRNRWQYFYNMTQYHTSQDRPKLRRLPLALRCEANILLKRVIRRVVLTKYRLNITR